MNKGFSTLFVLAAGAVMLQLQGCHAVAPVEQPKIGFVENKYRVCRENCPQPTPKEMDDTELEPAIFIAHSKSENTGPENPSNISPDTNESADQPVEIYFNFGMSKPNMLGREALRRFSDLAVAHPVHEILLVGQTDEIGTEDFNDKLARKRAEYVSKWLIAHGITSNITISEEVACCLAAPYDKQDKKLIEERRVFITYK